MSHFPHSSGHPSHLFASTSVDVGLSVSCQLLWGNLQHLLYLDLSNNQHSGPLPASLCNLKMLKEIVLDKNGLDGQLGPVIGQLQAAALHLVVYIYEFHLLRTSYRAEKSAEP
jgi:hypothetical protein